MYIVNDDLSGHYDPLVPPPKRFHLIVLAKNTIGYRNLVKLTTMAHLSGKVGKGIFARPCINKAQLYQHREGLVVSSACLGGEIAQAILNDDIDAARRVATWFRDVFGDDFYLEIQDHGSAEDKKVNPIVVQLSEELDIKLIATNDSHFTTCLDAEAHDAMICIQTGKLLTDDNRLHYAGNEYFKSIEEMRQCFIDHLPVHTIDTALYNTIGVASKIEQYDLFGATRIPDFPIPNFTQSHDDYLCHVARLGLTDRLRARRVNGLVETNVIKPYSERLEEELKMICQMGFSSYFLVVWDYIKYAREVNIPVGPGRGSAAGSLVAFALRITDVDPIVFNLLFERFLNPERKSMPDIDTDFSVEGRERVISYVTERYGHDQVAQIITFNRLTSKAVLKDVARVHNVPYAEADRLAKLIPVIRGKPALLSQMLSAETPSPDFRRVVERNPSYNIWLDKAKRIEGANKTFGIHAAGVVISATPLTDVVPLSRAKHGETITQYAMEDVEALGLLKMDFLGLKNLSIIETALYFINEGRRRHGVREYIDFSVDRLPLNDTKTYKLLAEGELDGIFQLDASGGMRGIVRELRPSNLEDISAILALYRPGPLDAGLIPKFIRRKHRLEPIEYEHPMLEPILQETYGIMVYQEQIMRIARDLAGYSLGEADILRRAMGKKKMKDMEREKPKFVDGAIRRGVSEATAVQLFDQMLKFAEYCFNKSHSTAYAYLTYQTAYLKANFPVEYCAALLKSNMNNSDKLVRYLADASAHGVRVLPPSVNRSEIGFTVNWDGKDNAFVLFGLEAVKTVGESVASALISERENNGPFHSIVDLIERVDMRVLNKRALGALVQAGAFDELHHNRKVLLKHLNDLLVIRRKLRDKRRRRQMKGMSAEEEELLKQEEIHTLEDAQFRLETDSSETADFDPLERLFGEKATMGFYASGHPLQGLQLVSNILGCVSVADVVGEEDRREHSDVDEVTTSENVMSDGTSVIILSCITDMKKMTTARGKKMGRWMIEDTTGRVPAVVFPEVYEVMEQIVKPKPVTNDIGNDLVNVDTELEQPYVVEEDARVIIWGKIDRESAGTVQVIVDDVQRVEDVCFIKATAEYDDSRSEAHQAHILRHAAAEVLDIELKEVQASTFIDANGERRRRRRKVLPLSKKNRVPLVLESLNAQGIPDVYLNAGNEVRFPIDCAEHLEVLYRKTGFSCRLCTVENLMVGTEKDVVTEKSSASKRGNDVRDDSSLESPALPVTAEPEVISNMNAFHEQPENDYVLEGSAEVGVTSTIETNITDEEILAELAKLHAKMASDNLEEPETVGFLEIDSDYEQNEVGLERNFGKFTQVLDRDPLSVQTFSKTRRLRQFSQHEAFQNDMGEVSFRATSDRTSRVATAPIYFDSSVLHKSSILEPPRQQNGSNDSTHLSFTSSKYATAAKGTSRHESIFSELSLENDKRKAEKSSSREDGRFGEDLRFENLRSANRSTNSDNDKNILGVELSAKQESTRPTTQASIQPPELHQMHFIKQYRGLGLTHSTPVDHNGNAFIDKTTVKIPEMSDGLTVKFDDAQLSGLLDAVVLVSSYTATKHSGQKHTLLGMSKVDVEKILENDVCIHISGHLAFSGEQTVCVLVDLRETKPSAKRKRVRSFGPVVVVFKLDEDVGRPELKTKNSRKSLESVVQKLAKCFISEQPVSMRTLESGSGKFQTKKKERKSILNVRASEIGFARDMNINSIVHADKSVLLMDGGEILAYMSRAAEVCASKVAGASGLTYLTAMEWMSASNTTMATPTNNVYVRTHLQGLSFDVIKVQVEAQFSTVDGNTHKMMALFYASCRDKRLVRRLRVINDDDPLFTMAEAVKPLVEIERRLRCFP